jgi:hypothetical protein
MRLLVTVYPFLFSGKHIFSLQSMFSLVFLKEKVCLLNKRIMKTEFPYLVSHDTSRLPTFRKKKRFPFKKKLLVIVTTLDPSISSKMI